MNTCVAQAHNASTRLREWLIGGAVQASSGPNDGAVAGSLDRENRAHYFYPEIVGYYLHWLAEANGSIGHAAAQPAQRAANWSTRVLANDRLPATRIFQGKESTSANSVGNSDDWRNRAVFFFDLSMLLRGLVAAHDQGLIADPSIAVDRLFAELTRFIVNDGQLFAARTRCDGTLLPVRWSTSFGAYEMKACSAILHVGKSRRLPLALSTACQQFNAQQLAAALQQPVDLLHPALYFAEGLMHSEPFDLTAVAHILAACLSLMRDDGCLPEGATSSVFRWDVTAQALRIGLLLRSNSVDSAPSREQLLRLASALSSRVCDGGTLPCRADGCDSSSNVWTAMFAEQALRWFVCDERGLGLPTPRWIT